MADTNYDMVLQVENNNAGWLTATAFDVAGGGRRVLANEPMPTSGSYTLNFTATSDSTYIAVTTGVDTTVDFTILMASMAKFATQQVNVPVFVLPAPSKYRFGFNGQEKVDEVAGVGNHLYFGAREYDPRDVKFWSVDPYFKKYPEASTYSFAGDNPIYFVDKDGNYKMSAKDQASYPTIAKYIHYQVRNDIMNSAKITTALNTFKANYPNSDYQTATNSLTRTVTWGSGPTLTFDSSPGFMGAKSHGHTVIGMTFDQDVITLNSTDVAKLEKVLKSNAPDKVKQKEFMKFYMTLVHETGHVTNVPDRVTNPNAPVDPDYHSQRRAALYQDDGKEPGYKVQQLIWGTKSYKPYDISNDLGNPENQSAYSLSDSELNEVITEASKTEEGKKTLPTTPSTSSSSSSSEKK